MFARLENLLALCYLCHVFTHFVLLGHVRTVLDMKTVRYITGRPSGRRRRDASPPTYFQMTLRLAF